MALDMHFNMEKNIAKARSTNPNKVEYLIPWVLWSSPLFAHSKACSRADMIIYQKSLRWDWSWKLWLQLRFSSWLSSVITKEVSDLDLLCGACTAFKPYTRSSGFPPTAGASPGDERHLRNSPPISISISAAAWRSSPPLGYTVLYCTVQVSGALYPPVDAQTISQ
jgi:hypothetical protein